MPENSAEPAFEHVRDEVQYLVRETEKLSRESFLQDETLQRAFVRSLQIISAASAALPEEFRARHPDIDWNRLIAINDRLIHEVFGTDLELIWVVVDTRIPALDRQIGELVGTWERGNV